MLKYIYAKFKFIRQNCHFYWLYGSLSSSSSPSFLHCLCLEFSFFFAAILVFNLFPKYSDYYENPIDGRFYCNVCGRNYVRKKHVLRHIRYECVNVPPRFYCANCSKQYRQSNALFHHIRQKHGPLARDTMNFSGFTQRNFKVANDGRVVFNCF